MEFSTLFETVSRTVRCRIDILFLRHKMLALLWFVLFLLLA
jgi:hypothetical protein